MNRHDTQKLLDAQDAMRSVQEHFLHGGEVEYLNVVGVWVDIESPSWIEHIMYRVKSKSHALGAAEAFELAEAGMWVISKKSGYRYLVTGVSFHSVQVNGDWISFEDLRTWYTDINGGTLEVKI